MQATIALEQVFCGTELNITQEGVPAVIPAEACYLGWQELVHVMASPGEMPASQRAQQTQALLNALTTRFGAPTRVVFGRLAGDGAAHQVAGAQFDLSSEYSDTRGLLESNEVAMRVSISKTDVEPPVETSIPFTEVLKVAHRRSPPAPPVRDFLNELLP
jgi:hypothetical protein